VPSARASAHYADLAGHIRQGAEKTDTSISISNNTFVRGATLSTYFSRNILGLTVTIATVEIWSNSYVAVIGIATSRLLVPLIPTGNVVKEKHGRERPLTKRTSQISMYAISAVALDSDGLGNHALIDTGISHRKNPPW
tara:strand:+ start:1235 stop:1651 length:417 start_codon:yes stop_codon:yes gene_type:complete